MTSHPFELGIQQTQLAQDTKESVVARREVDRKEQEEILYTTTAVGEEGGWRITQAEGFGENGEGMRDRIIEKPIDPIGNPGEEPGRVTTLALGEEGGQDGCWIDGGDRLDWSSWCDRVSVDPPLPNVGDSQENPFLPDRIVDNGNGWWFHEVPNRQWFDPPTTFGFSYEMASDSLFTSILDFPTGFDSSFTVSTGGESLGQFSPGETVDFVDLFGKGVPKFTVTGISPTVDASDPTAFPLKLEFNTARASFEMRGIEAPDATSVPEPGLLSGVLLGSAIAAYFTRFRKSL